jgi:hypothetical protein
MSADLLPVPPRPFPRGLEWGDFPNLLVYSRHLSIGWQNRPEKKGGACFLVGHTTVTGGTKVVERFPYTDEGWARTWRFVMQRDKFLEGDLRKTLEARWSADHAAAELERLDSAALVNLPSVFFLGGYAENADLADGQPYDLRFLSDRLTISQHRSIEDALIELAYANVEVLDVGGPGVVSRFSREGQAGMTLAFGLLGAAIAYTDTKIQTFVRIQFAGGELNFLSTAMTPDALRIQLARPLGAIREAHAAGGSIESAQGSAAGAVAELSRLASLLDAGLLTRDEFDRLKARLLAG